MPTKPPARFIHQDVANGLRAAGSAIGRAVSPYAPAITGPMASARTAFSSPTINAPPQSPLANNFPGFGEVGFLNQGGAGQQAYRHQQLGGLQNLHQQLQSMNAANAARPVTPYQPGTQPPTGNQTYGGQFGTFNPAPVGLSSQEVLAGARGERPIQPGALSDFGNNLGGRFYGGTTPQMVSAPGGGMRPGFLAPPNQQADGMSADQKQQFAQATGNYFNPQTGALEGSNLSLSPMQQRLAGVVGGLPNRVLAPNSPQLAENRQRYLANREKAQQARATGQTPFQQRLAKQEAAAQTGFERMLGVRNPEAFARLQEGRQRQAMHESGLKSQETIAAGNQRTQADIAKGTQETNRYTADQRLASDRERTKAQIESNAATLAAQERMNQSRVGATDKATEVRKQAAEATAEQNKLLTQQRAEAQRSETYQKLLAQNIPPQEAARQADLLHPGLTPLTPQAATGQAANSPFSPFTGNPLEAPKADELRNLAPDELNTVLSKYPPATQERLRRELSTPSALSRFLYLSPLDPNVPAAYRYIPPLRASASMVSTRPPIGLSPRAKQIKNQNPGVFAPGKFPRPRGQSFGVSGSF